MVHAKLTYGHKQSNKPKIKERSRIKCVIKVSKKKNTQIKKKTCMQENNSKENTTPTPKITVHRSSHMK